MLGSMEKSHEIQTNSEWSVSVNHHELLRDILHLAIPVA